jgi:hypothetical protein
MLEEVWSLLSLTSIPNSDNRNSGLNKYSEEYPKENT